MAKKPPRKPAPRRKRATTAALLTPAERNRVLRAPENYEELARKTAAKLAQQDSIPAGDVLDTDTVFNRGTGEGWATDGDV